VKDRVCVRYIVCQRNFCERVCDSVCVCEAEIVCVCVCVCENV
jgi:hypothetical protein